MTTYFLHDNQPATGAIAVYELMHFLATGGPGWLIKADSDGTTYASSGGQVTGGASGSHGLANNSAWIRIQGPGGQEFVIQRATTNVSWRVKYSMAAHFTGGSPSATQVPSATDEEIMLGAGTDASPTFSAWVATDNGYRFHAIADSANAYGFLSFGFPIGGGAPTHAFVFEPLNPQIPGDAHPYWIYLAQSSAFVAVSLTASSTGATGGPYSTVPAASPTAASFAGFPAAIETDGVGQTVPNGYPSDPVTTKDPGHLMKVGRRAALTTNVGYKGYLQNIRWKGVTRSTGQIMDNSAPGAGDQIVVGDILSRWDNNALLV